MKLSSRQKRFERRSSVPIPAPGRDIPEAIFEALYESIRAYTWESESRLVILIGDAPPHPEPRGKVTEDLVYEKAEVNNVKITAIILPQ